MIPKFALESKGVEAIYVYQIWDIAQMMSMAKDCTQEDSRSVIPRLEYL